MRQPFPLQWPAGWARIDPTKRERALFRVTLTEGVQDLLYDLRLMKASNVVITSDLPTNSRGLPYASGKADDPGIAVWCVVDGAERVFACDRWSTAAANLRAIGKTVEAIRKIGDWGAADMVTRAFSGFAALPPGAEQEMAPNQASSPTKSWRDVFRDLSPAWATRGAGHDIVDRVNKRSAHADRALCLRLIAQRHREHIRTAHPDVGGTHERAAELNVALHDAEVELGGA
jgi:hypothetical protein